VAETVIQRKAVGIVWLLAAIAGIVLAFVAQPIGEWGPFGVLLAVVLAFLGLTGLWIAVTGKGRILGRSLSPKANRIVAIIGLVAATLLIISNVVSDWANWTAVDVLTIAVWVAIGAMFIEGIVATRKAA
jgi:nicotinamide riboside transporter PnuC